MKHIGLFEGIGGFGLAAKRANIETVLICENNLDRWPDLKRNFIGVPIHADVRDLTKKLIYEYCGPLNTNELVLTGGFPCQDISIAGKGRGIDGRKSGLWSEFYRLTEALHPRCILAENSNQITRKGLDKILCDLAKIGYDVEWESFFASEFVYDHKRHRTYILAYPSGERRPGILHAVKRQCQQKNKKRQIYDSLGASSHPFLRFTKSNSEPVIFGVDDGISSRMVVPALEGYGNAVVPSIPEAIFKAFQANP